MMSSPFSPFLLLNFSVLKYSFSSYLYLWLLYWEVLFFCWFQQLSQLLTQHSLSLCDICIILALETFFFKCEFRLFWFFNTLNNIELYPEHYEYCGIRAWVLFKLCRILIFLVSQSRFMPQVPYCFPWAIIPVSGHFSKSLSWPSDLSCVCIIQWSVGAWGWSVC